VWVVSAVYGLAFVPWGLAALGGDALIVGTILRGTGIPDGGAGTPQQE